MAKEYIERDAVINRLQTVSMPDDPYSKGIQHGVVHSIAVINEAPAADVVEVFRGDEAVLAEIENDYKDDFEKIKTHIAQIIVEGKVEKPYYSILWFDEENKEYNIGYSSYCLDYVRKWLEVVFEVIDAPADVVEVVHGRWEYLQDDEWRCSNCHTVFNTEGKWIPMTDNFCSECGADMRERRDNNPNCGGRYDHAETD